MVQWYNRWKLFRRFHTLLMEENEVELDKLRSELYMMKRYEVVFESAAQATFQIAIVMVTGMVLTFFSKGKGCMEGKLV